MSVRDPRSCSMRDRSVGQSRCRGLPRGLANNLLMSSRFPRDCLDRRQLLHTVSQARQPIDTAARRDAPRAGCVCSAFPAGEVYMRHAIPPDDPKARTIEGDTPKLGHTEREDQNPGRVIIVDDSPANLVLLTRQLARDGYIVYTATNGEEALDLVARERPDVVLMDVMMPRRDGFDTCRALKQNASTRLIPVVRVTSLRDSTDKMRGLGA